MRVVIVTGLAGAGKSTALRALEDLGFFCVDNMPLPLLSQFVELLHDESLESAAVVIDARQPQFLARYRQEVDRLERQGHRVEVLFLEARDEILLRRYSETRRRHPLSGDDLKEGIRRDRELLVPLHHDAEGAVVDTGRLNVHQLKGIIQERYGRHEGSLAVTLLSFGFKNGLPPEADLVYDVRFLPNPYFVEALSGSNGRAPEVSEFVLGSADGGELVDRVEAFLRFALPQFAREGKVYLTIAIGCTGGRHRSVAVVEELGRRLGDDWDLVVRHRDLSEAAMGGM